MALTPLSDALSTLLAQVDLTPETEWVALEAAGGRYAAEAVHSTVSVPPADNSAMDGFAVRAGDLPAVQRVSQRIPAGSAPTALEPGTAARIFTGAEIPEGADAAHGEGIITAQLQLLGKAGPQRLHTTHRSQHRTP